MYYLNDSLSDIKLTDSDTGKSYNCHKVVLAAASTLVREHSELNEINTPRRYIRLRIAEEENIIFEQIILRYIYSNQNFEILKILISS
jgi:hypothetical protein